MGLSLERTERCGADEVRRVGRQHRPSRQGEAVVGPPGSDNRARWQGSPRNLGDPIDSVETNGWGAVDQNPGLRAPTPCPARANKANRRNRSYKPNEASGDGGKSERPSSTEEAGEPPRGTRRREEGRRVQRTVEGKEGLRCQS